LTVARAAELLMASRSLSGVEQVTYETPHGCFVLDADQRLDGAALDRDPQLAENHQLKALIDRERQLDLLEFEFSPTPIGSTSVPPDCHRQWLAYRSGAIGVKEPGARLVAWRALMSDKAVAAGLQPGQSFIARRQTLIAIGKIVMRSDQSAAVDYTWHWEPTYEAQHLGFAPTEPRRSVAIFKWDGHAWSVAQ
jgi:hypothetical protein